MRHFLKIAENANIGPLLQAVYCQPELWNQYKVRTTDEGPLSVHKPIDDIVLRYNPYVKGEDYLDKICSSIYCVDYPAWHKLPEAQSLILGLMNVVRGYVLGRCMISRVAPGQTIPLHSDRIGPAEEAFPDRPPPALYYERYHIVLQSAMGTQFFCGGDEGREEEIYMAPGEVWWFDNQQKHLVENNSALDRIHLICDIRTKHDFYVPGV